MIVICNYRRQDKDGVYLISSGSCAQSYMLNKESACNLFTRIDYMLQAYVNELYSRSL